MTQREPRRDSHDLTWPAGAVPPAVSGEDDERRVVSIAGSAVRKGRWNAAPACRVRDVAGGVELDLGDADRVEIRVTSIMASSAISVPDGINVEVSETGVMATNTFKLDDRTPNPGGPTVHLMLYSVMGGTDVKRARPKRTLRERLMRRRGTTSP